MFKTYTKNDFEEIVFEIKNGKAAIIATDTVIGIVCLYPELIYQIKQRPLEKKLIKFVCDYNQIPYISDTDIQFLKKFWPGQVTSVIQNQAYRMPDDDWLLLLLSKTGPLYSSSANISNGNVIDRISDADFTFNEKFFYNLILILDDKEPGIIEPSTIVDLESWKILRKGAQYDLVKSYIDNIKGKRYKGENS